MPATACEHLSISNLHKLRGAHTTALSEGSSLAQYICSECPFSGNFPSLQQHFKKTQHPFAAGTKAIFCAQCNDLIYESSITGMPSTAKKRKLAQYSEEEESFMSNNTSARPCGREGVRGLFNLGETCYMNAVLQMMVHNPLLASYFLGMGHPVHLCPISRDQDKKNESDSEDDDSSVEKPEQKVCVACGMTDVFSDITMADTPGPAHAVNLLFASWKNIPVSSVTARRFPKLTVAAAHVR
jgi:ubiquitin carboxyl-terminal hydrolase 22/27/51